MKGRTRRYKRPMHKTVTLEATEVRAVQDHAKAAGASFSETARALVLTALAWARQERRKDEGSP